MFGFFSIFVRHCFCARNVSGKRASEKLHTLHNPSMNPEKQTDRSPLYILNFVTGLYWLVEICDLKVPDVDYIIVAITFILTTILLLIKYWGEAKGKEKTYLVILLIIMVIVVIQLIISALLFFGFIVK